MSDADELRYRLRVKEAELDRIMSRIGAFDARYQMTGPADRAEQHAPLSQRLPSDTQIQQRVADTRRAKHLEYQIGRLTTQLVDAETPRPDFTSLRPGHVVRTGDGWWRVGRVNAKTITVYGSSYRIPYHRIIEIAEDLP